MLRRPRRPRENILRKREAPRRGLRAIIKHVKLGRLCVAVCYAAETETREQKHASKGFEVIFPTPLKPSGSDRNAVLKLLGEDRNHFTVFQITPRPTADFADFETLKQTNSRGRAYGGSLSDSAKETPQTPHRGLIDDSDVAAHRAFAAKGDGDHEP